MLAELDFRNCYKDYLRKLASVIKPDLGKELFETRGRCVENLARNLIKGVEDKEGFECSDPLPRPKKFIRFILQLDKDTLDLSKVRGISASRFPEIKEIIQSKPTNNRNLKFAYFKNSSTF